MTATAALTPLLSLIEKTWGYRHLRPLQREAMETVLAKRDSVVVLPTGGGKSLCYQAPAVHLAQSDQGPTLVVSPLIALMKDQVDSLRSVGVAAAQLDSSMTPEERRQVASELRTGRLHLLFVSPERLVGRGEENGTEGGNNGFLQMLQQAQVRTFAIDEAHCISHWGHDFRPEYRRLSLLKTLFPGCSVHAYTATATEQVRRDIAAQLQLHNPATLVGNFDRPNLLYRVLPRHDMFQQIQHVLERHADEAGIIYCLRRKDVDEIVATLNAGPMAHRKALGYHAGMTPESRRRTQEAFAREECDLIVATVAFGMGIDRSNIRFVLHTGMPKSIEAYQQETGRAGRDGLEAECVMLYSGQDMMTGKALIERSADEAAAAGTAVSPDYLAAALGQLDKMDRFARGAVCRHQALVEHFGQRYQPPAPPAVETADRPADGTPANERDSANPASCHACDHCLGDTEPVPEALVIAQKILSTVARTEQRFGIGHVISVLRGENTAKARQFHHDQLSVYGLLRDLQPTELRNFVYQLISQGVLTQENLVLSNGRAVPILKLNQASMEVMKSKQPVRLMQLARHVTDAQAPTADISWQGVDRELFDALRHLRRELATRRGMPPYVIFSDATLRQLARHRPTTTVNLRLIYGIGQTKVADFGPHILPLIKSHCAAHKRATDVPVSAPSATPLPRPATVRPNTTRAQALALFRQGASIEQVARQTARTPGTIAGYLADYIAAEHPPSIAHWVPEPIQKRVRAAIKQVGDTRLKPIFVALDEAVSYEMIRLVIAHQPPKS